MKYFTFLILMVLFGCKHTETSELDKLAERRMEMEEEIMRDQTQQSVEVDFKDNLENELQGTEAELLRMNKINDSLLNELYKCQNQ